MMFTINKRYKLIGAALAVVPLTLLSACASGSTGSPAGPTDGEVGGEVRMLVNLTDNLTQAYWEELVAPFEEKTGVDVKIEGPTGKSVAETLPTQLAAGTAPDVIQSIFPDAKTAPELLDLTDEPWAEGTPLVENYTLEGRTYVVGVGAQAQSLVFYNKDAFAAAGIEGTPETWEQFDDALADLSDAGFTPLQTGGQYLTGLQAQQLWHPTLNTDHPDWQTAVTDDALTVGEVYEPLFEHYSDWISSGAVAQTDVGLDPAAADANFISGTVGMYPLGSWFVATLESAGELPFEVGVFSPPVDEGMAYPGPQGATMADPYMIYGGTKNVASSKALVEYLVTDEDAIQSQLLADGVFRAGVEAQTSDAGVAVQQIIDAAPSLVDVGEGAGDNRLPVTGFNPKFTEIVQSLYTGATAADAAAAIDQWVTESR